MTAHFAFAALKSAGRFIRIGRSLLNCAGHPFRQFSSRRFPGKLEHSPTEQANIGSGTALSALLEFIRGWTAMAAARRLWIALPLAGLVCGCTTATVTNKTVQVEVEVLNSARKFQHVYLVQAGDQLEIFLQRHADLSRKVAVRPDGYITLPLVDEVKAAGKSPRELAAELKVLYSVRLKDPEINVIVLNPPEPMVYVVGQVGAPKALPLRQASTLAQAIAQSGDATKHAATDGISVIRLNADGYLESRALKVDKDASQPEVYMAMASMPLQSDDLILVSESQRSQILRAMTDTNVALTPLWNVLLLYEIFHPHP
jgi:polysaccharide biosynthesis/export protein